MLIYNSTLWTKKILHQKSEIFSKSSLYLKLTWEKISWIFSKSSLYLKLTWEKIASKNLHTFLLPRSSVGIEKLFWPICPSLSDKMCHEKWHRSLYPKLTLCCSEIWLCPLIELALAKLVRRVSGNRKVFWTSLPVADGKNGKVSV